MIPPLIVPNMSPILAIMTFFTCVRGNTNSSVLAKFSNTMMVLAPLSFSWCSNSRGVYKGLVFTTTKPAFRMPNTAIGYCRIFGIMMATRSPRGSFSTFCRYDATWSDNCPTS